MPRLVIMGIGPRQSLRSSQPIGAVAAAELRPVKHSGILHSLQVSSQECSASPKICPLTSEKRALPNVAPDHICGTMPSLGHDHSS
jgi:hypothetical protein